MSLSYQKLKVKRLRIPFSGEEAKKKCHGRKSHLPTLEDKLRGVLIYYHTTIIKSVNLEDISLTKNSKYITKSISGVRSMVVNNDEFSTWNKEGLNALPTLFQKQVDGNDVRVHITISQESVDFCLATSYLEHNPLIGIEFIQLTDGYVFLESNPMPGWDYFFKKDASKEKVCCAIMATMSEFHKLMSIRQGLVLSVLALFACIVWGIITLCCTIVKDYFNLTVYFKNSPLAITTLKIQSLSIVIDKLDAIEKKYEEVSKQMVDPAMMADMKQYAAISKAYKELSKVVDAYSTYKKTVADLEGAKALLSTEKDADFRELAKEEIDRLTTQHTQIEEELKMLLLPKDPNDSKNVILELRAGTGGDEAGIFAGDLFRMYSRFIEKMNWKLSVIEALESTSGGYKEIICNIAGEGAYGMLKYESGVHRVQRVPATETQGRIHTSAASIVVLPEMDEVEVHLDMNEIRKDTFCSSGPGGQSVNTTYSAIRLTHLPTGIVVSCQDEKSQIKNLEKALKVLRARLYEQELKKQQEAIGAERKSMVKSGDRSDKIRTYNFPQGRVTDHRIGYTIHNLPAVMDGAIDDLVEALRLADTAEKLQQEI
eukprot:gene162-216_t